MSDRDDKGNFLPCSTTWYDSVPNALTVEALTCKDGLALAANWGLQKIVVETGNKNLMSSWKSIPSFLPNELR